MRELLLKLLILTLGMIQVAQAQHLTVDFSKKGLKSVFESLLDTVKENTNHKIIVDRDRARLKIDKEDIENTPIIKTLREYLHFENTEDFVYDISWDDTEIEGDVVRDSLKVFTDTNNGNTEIAVKFSLSQVKLTTDTLELCEIKNQKCNKNGEGLYVKFSNPGVSLIKGDILDLVLVLSLEKKDDSISISFKEILSNLMAPEDSRQRDLYSKYGLDKRDAHLYLWLPEENLHIPKIHITIDEKRFAINSSKLKNAVLKEKTFITNQLSTGIGIFLAQELVSILEDSFIESLKGIQKDLTVINLDNSKKMMYSKPFFVEPSSSTYVHHNIISKSSYDENDEYDDNVNSSPSNNEFTESLKEILNQTFYKANITGGIKEFSTTGTSGLKIGLESQKLNVNYTNYTVSPYRKIPFDSDYGFVLRGDRFRQTKIRKPGFKKHTAENNYDFAVAVSESFVNTIFNISNETGFFSTAFNNLADMPGVYLNNIQVHFDKKNEDDYKLPLFFDNTEYTHVSNQPITIVAGLEVDLNMQDDGFFSKDFFENIKNYIGSLIEEGNIWFPVELEVYPAIYKDPIDGETYIKFFAVNPVRSGKLLNTYNYPYKEMSQTVHGPLLETLTKAIVPMISNIKPINIQKYLSFGNEMKFDPRGITVNSTGQIVIMGDILKLDINGLQEKYNDKN